MLKKNVTLKLEDITLAGQLYLPDSNGNHPLVCICHGIPSGKPPDPDDGGYPLFAERICDHGFAVFIFNFRGTGESGGNLDILGWTRDLRAAIDYIWSLSEVDKSRVSLLGFSAGAAVSVVVAAEDKRISSVAACACPAEFNFFTENNEAKSIVDHFRNIGAIRDEDFPDSPEEWFNGFRVVSPIKHVAEIAPRKLLIIHGNKDETVDVSHAFQMHDNAGEPRQIGIIDGAGHRLRQDERTLAAFLDWLKSQCGK